MQLEEVHYRTPFDDADTAGAGAGAGAGVGAGAEAFASGMHEDRDSMGRAAASLRLYDGAWRALTRKVGLSEATSAGSFAKELVAVVDMHGTLNLLETKADARALFLLVQQTLCTRHGMLQGRAAVVARDIVRPMAHRNVSALSAIHQVLAAETSGLCITTLVLRISIRSVKQMGAGEEEAWFRNTHANALIVHPGHMILVEPSFPTPMPSLVNKLAEVFRIMPMCTHSTGVAPVTNLALCTLSAAVLTLCLLANPDVTQTQAGLSALTQWVHRHQHWLLRRLTASVLSDSCSPLPAPE